MQTQILWKHNNNSIFQRESALSQPIDVTNVTDKSKPVSVGPYRRIAGCTPHPTVRGEQPLSVFYGTHGRSSVPSGQAKTPRWYTARDARSLCYTFRNPCFDIPYISLRNSRNIARAVLCWLQQKRERELGNQIAKAHRLLFLEEREAKRAGWIAWNKAESIQLYNLINCVN